MKQPFSRFHQISDLVLGGYLLISVTITIHVLVVGLPDGYRAAAIMGLLVGTIVALAACFRLEAKNRANITVLLSSIVLSLYGAQSYLLLTEPGAYFSRFDGRSKFDVVQDLRAEGKYAYPMVGPSSFLGKPLNAGGEATLPLSSVRNAVTAICKENGPWIIDTTDQHGFMNPPDAWRRRPVKLAIVGDSFAQGVCVAWSDSFAGRIRQALGNTINVGISGNGPLVELGTLKEYIAPLQPSIVLWVYFEDNDLRELATEKNDSIARRYLEPGFTQHLIQREAAVDRALIARIDEEEKIYRTQIVEPDLRDRFHDFLYYLRLGLLRDYVTDALDVQLNATVERHHTSPTPFEDFHDVLNEANRTVGGWGGRLFIVYLPSLRSILGGIAPPHRSRVLKIIEALNIPLIDLYPDFVNHEDKLSLLPRMHLHYSEKGNRLIAGKIIAALENRAE